jgi:hypothetical protein
MALLLHQLMTQALKFVSAHALVRTYHREGLLTRLQNCAFYSAVGNQLAVFNTNFRRRRRHRHR